MQLNLTLPDAVHTLLAAHPKGAEAAAIIAIKRYLKATASEGRDQAIADEAVRGATHAELANKYALSIPRIQQLVALGRDAALLRNPPAPKPTHSATPKRVLTPQDRADILRMDAEGVTQAEIMRVFGITMDTLQTVLWSDPPTHTTTTHSATLNRKVTEPHTTTTIHSATPNRKVTEPHTTTTTTHTTTPNRKVTEPYTTTTHSATLDLTIDF